MTSSWTSPAAGPFRWRSDRPRLSSGTTARGSFGWTIDLYPEEVREGRFDDGAAMKTARMSFENPGRKASEHELADETSIGRGLGNSIVLDDSEVSRRHLVVVRDREGRLFARDLGSANGTLLNGRRIVVPALLQDGD